LIPTVAFWNEADLAGTIGWLGQYLRLADMPDVYPSINHRWTSGLQKVT